MSINRGEIVLVDYPFPSGGGKVRPALIVRNDLRRPEQLVVPAAKLQEGKQLRSTRPGSYTGSSRLPSLRDRDNKLSRPPVRKKVHFADPSHRGTISG